MKRKELTMTIHNESDVQLISEALEQELREKDVSEITALQECSDGYHHILIDDLGLPQCSHCLLTFDGWKAVKIELQKKYSEYGDDVVQERLLKLKKVSSKVKRWNKANFPITVSFFRVDPVLKGRVQFISRTFYNPWDQNNKT